MDPRTNPYAPGVGAPPPELAGRDALIEDAAIALDLIRNGLAAKSILMVGLRGVGKTVLLNRMSEDARCRGFTTILLEAPEDQSLPPAAARCAGAAQPPCGDKSRSASRPEGVGGVGWHHQGRQPGFQH